MERMTCVHKTTFQKKGYLISRNSCRIIDIRRDTAQDHCVPNREIILVIHQTHLNTTSNWWMSWIHAESIENRLKLSRRNYRYTDLKWLMVTHRCNRHKHQTSHSVHVKDIIKTTNCPNISHAGLVKINGLHILATPQLGMCYFFFSVSFNSDELLHTVISFIPSKFSNSIVVKSSYITVLLTRISVYVLAIAAIWNPYWYWVSRIVFLLSICVAIPYDTPPSRHFVA